MHLALPSPKLTSPYHVLTTTEAKKVEEDVPQPETTTDAEMDESVSCLVVAME